MTVAFDDPVLAAADRFLKTFQRPARLLAAVSGGSDSTGLFIAFATLLSAGRHPHITLCAATAAGTGAGRCTPCGRPYATWAS